MRGGSINDGTGFAWVERGYHCGHSVGVYEARSAKRNGSSGRIESLEKKIDDLCNEFRLFREEVKLRQVREDTLREVSNG